MPEEASFPEPWFKDGLRFECTRCGACCTGAPGYVWLTEEETKKLAAYRGEKLNEFEDVYTRQVRGGVSLRERPNGDCIFWEKGRGCTVYPVRPSQCRTWPFWESNLETRDAWERTESVCPGSGEGELIPVDEILRRMKVIKL
jgi:uncharacterized protein